MDAWMDGWMNGFKHCWMYGWVVLAQRCGKTKMSRTFFLVAVTFYCPLQVIKAAVDLKSLSPTPKHGSKSSWITSLHVNDELWSDSCVTGVKAWLLWLNGPCQPGHFKLFLNALLWWWKKNSYRTENLKKNKLQHVWHVTDVWVAVSCKLPVEDVGYFLYIFLLYQV